VTELEHLLSGRYRLDEIVGRGAMASVWRGYDLQLKRVVAVKVFDRSVAADLQDANAETRFRREAVAAARLTHPYVAAVYDAGTDDGRLYLVMEYLPGGSLADLLAADGALPVLVAIEYAAQVAEGLAAAHRAGVLHRDVKPGNLLLDADDTVKMVDFGIAEVAGEAAARLTANGQVIGSGAYLAPERALGRPAGPAADFYSLGCVLYELLTGARPFRSPSAAGQAHAHVHTAPVRPSARRPGIPPAVDAVVLGLMAKDPAARPDDGMTLAAMLRAAALADSRPDGAADTGTFHTTVLESVAPVAPPTTAVPPRSAEPARTAGGRHTGDVADAGARRSRVLAIAAVVTVAVAAAVTVLLAMQSTRQPVQGTGQDRSRAGDAAAVADAASPTAAVTTSPTATPSSTAGGRSATPSPTTSTSAVQLPIPTAVPDASASPSEGGGSADLLSGLSGRLRFEARVNRLPVNAAREAIDDLDRAADLLRRGDAQEAADRTGRALGVLDQAQQDGWRPTRETSQLIDEVRAKLS
jgi:serine/threonine-protein kinase